MKAAEKWLLDHMEGSEGLGAIFPADGLHAHRLVRAGLSR